MMMDVIKTGYLNYSFSMVQQKQVTLKMRIEDCKKRSRSSTIFAVGSQTRFETGLSFGMIVVICMSFECIARSLERDMGLPEGDLFRKKRLMAVSSQSSDKYCVFIVRHDVEANMNAYPPLYIMGF
ncbi:unnamed protein product [Amoebophrya sp. A25]|nr:unnamed protein product [Amoebophrya sp. A25]|eukprot:GSA25T00001775001.1